MTKQVVLAGGYHLPEIGFVRLSHVDTMLSLTKVIAPSLGNLSAPDDSRSYSTTEITLHAGLVLEAAVESRRKHGDKVAAVSAASAYHCGGGFLTGGRHALEEAICVQTPLFESLLSVRRQAFPDASDSEPGAMYIPVDGCIVSPKVEVFRQGSGDGYTFMESPALLGALVSVAMFNRNDRLRDAPVDAPGSDEEYNSAVKAKLRAVLAGAVQADCDAVVIPDVGCGVYKNDPKVVGRLLGELVRQEFWGQLKEVIVVGSQAFKDSVVEAAKDP